VNIGKIYRFLVICFGLSWFLALLFFLLPLDWQGLEGGIFGLIYMFMPALAVVLVQRMEGRPPLQSMGFKWKINWWWLLSLLLPVVLAFLALGVSLIFPGVEFSPEMAGLMERFAVLLAPEEIEQMEGGFLRPLLLILVQTLLFGLTLNAVAGFGEELGWRGFLQREMENAGFWISSLIIGFIWGLWHAPLILQGHNYPTYPFLGVIMMILWCMLLAPLFGYIRLRAGSVIAPSIMHGSLNASVGLSTMYVRGGSELTVGLPGLAGFIVLLIINILLYFRDPDPGKLERESR